MIDFVRDWFRGIYTVFLWICLITFVVIGVRIGASIADGEVTGGFLGFIVGGFVGLVAVVIIGGIIATFLNIDDSLERISGRLHSLNLSARTSDEAVTVRTSIAATGTHIFKDVSKICEGCKRSIDWDYKTCPHCGGKTFK